MFTSTHFCSHLAKSMAWKKGAASLYTGGSNNPLMAVAATAFMASAGRRLSQLPHCKSLAALVEKQRMHVRLASAMSSRSKAMRCCVAAASAAPTAGTTPAVPGTHVVGADGVALVPSAIAAVAGAVAMVPGVIVVAAGGVAAR
jgi:hypothetical protein